jgi:hypothetical protein
MFHGEQPKSFLKKKQITATHFHRERIVESARSDSHKRLKWDRQDGVMKDLGTLGGADSAVGGINERRQMVFALASLTWGKPDVALAQ